MWIVSIVRLYYPIVLTYNNYDEAVEEYICKNEYYKNDKWVSVYLSEVIEPF